MSAEKNTGAESAVRRTIRPETLQIEAFEPADVRPWSYHNRSDTGLDDASLDDLANSIRRDGQQQLGLARRLPPGDTHLVEAIYGVRRLEACRRAETLWRAEVRDESLTDAQCAALMHSENEWSEGVSPLENAVQWKALLDARVFKNQSALANALGLHRGRVSRAVRAATVLLGERWISRLVRPVMHQFTGRSADRLVEALADEEKRSMARERARAIATGSLSANQIYDALFGERDTSRETVYVRRGKSAGRGVVAARIERGAGGGWSVLVRPHEQSPVEMAELAEQVEAVLATETAPAGGVRLGRRLVSLLSPEDAQNADQSWLEGCVWATAQASGLGWDRWRCMAVAEALRSQRGGWEQSVVRAIGGSQADPAGA